MKKVSFRIRNFDNEQFLTFNIDNAAHLDEEVLDFIEEDEPEGIVPVIFEEGDEFDTFSYNITDRICINELSNQEINAEMVLKVLHGLVLTLMDMEENRIPLSYLVLHRKYIYVDSDYKITFICIPLEEIQDEVDLNNFLRTFLSNLRFESSENGDYVARLLSYINNQAIFNLRNLLTLIEDLMADMGIELPENESAEIYAEYHEVEEIPEDSKEGPDSFEETADVDTSYDIYDDEEKSEDSQETIFTEENHYESAENNVDDSTEAYADVNSDIYTNGEYNQNPDRDNTADPAAMGTENETSYVKEDDTEMPPETHTETLSDEQIEMPPKEHTTIPSEEPEAIKRKSKFKTKNDALPGVVVIEDDLEDFLAEKEYEDRKAHQDEGSIKIKKNIKINRASIVQNTIDELKAAEEKEEEHIAEELSKEAQDKIEDTDRTVQKPKKNTDEKVKEPPKINPYLLRINTAERIMITKQNFKIGKSNRADYTVDGNNAVSRIHAIITNKDGGYYIKDNKSTNHTYVNGKEVTDGNGELLTHDSKIVLGDEEFIFKLS